VFAKRSRVLALAALAAAAPSACYDMPLIPDDSPTVAGSGGHGHAGAGAGTHQGGAPANAGAPHTDGGSKPSGGSSSSAGAAGKNTGTGGTTGLGGSAPTVTWLDLDGSTAPSSSLTNSKLGIQGSFYAYGDDCATKTLQWDESSRCVSGVLCEPLDGWGISIGFDFHNTGPDGSPRNAKLTWNPEDVGARGVVWLIRGKAPQLQVWVLNMASSWQGVCTGMPCEIDGPPDGTDSATLNGELYFDNMKKDNWGSGTQYTFDPAAVHALQFKIATVKVGAVAYDFCIDGLGIIH